MSQPKSDPLFERLEALRPRLASYIRLLPQTYRGERWFVLANEASGQFMRFNASAYAAIGRFDGRMTLADVYTLINRDDNALSEQELAALVLQLGNLNALRDPLPDDVQALTGSSKKTSGGSSINPLALRFALLDPDRFLDIAMPWVLPLFSKISAACWAISVFFALIIGVTHFNSIAAAVNTSLLSPKNLILGIVVFMVMKIIHEFAHAFAVKRWGGEVHEMGISLLVLMPVPYVDASASWAFRNKYRRALVGGVGILVELWIAAIAVIVFVGVEPGLVRDIALNAMLIGGFSTLLVNGNPLLRFDGYYVLQDLFELPNLSTRASRYLQYLTQRYMLGIEDARSPVTATGERRWLLGYGVAAALYRIFILCVIALFLASKYLAVGVALVTWVVVIQLVLPAIRAIWFLLSEKKLAGRRPIALARVAILPLALIFVLGFLPVNNSTVVQGIVWLPEQAQLYSKSTGVVAEIMATSGTQVTTDSVLFKLHNPDLSLRRNVLTARLKELEARQRAAQFSDRTAADVAGEEQQSVRAEIASNDEQIAELVIKSPHDGTLVFADAQSLLGRYIKQGDLLAYIVNKNDYVVRSVVSQRDIGRVRAGVTDVEVRLAEHLDAPIHAEVLRETPGGHKRLPSRALSRAGGGKIDTEPGDTNAVRTIAEVFNVDIALPAETATRGIGGRAFVRYNHTPKPLLSQWHERVRQLVLRRLAV